MSILTEATRNDIPLVKKRVDTRTEKRCTGCDQQKPLGAFSPKARGDYESYCRPCNAKRAKRWRVHNPEKRALQAKRWRLANRQKHCEISMRHYRKLTPAQLERRRILRTKRYNHIRKYIPYRLLRVRGLRQRIPNSL